MLWLTIKGNMCMNEPRGHYSKWNMPVAEGQIFYDSIKVSKKSNS